MAEYQFNPTYNELIIKFRDGVSLLQLEQLALEHEKIIQYANLKLPKGRLLMSLFDAKNFSFFKHKCTFLFSIAKQELSFFNEISSKSLKCADELGSLYAVIKYKKNYDLFNDFIEQIGKNRAYSNQGTTKLYYLKIRHKNKNYYKIGITNRSVKERYKPSEAKKIESILFENFINDAEILENCLLVHYAEFRTNNPEVFLDGYTEVFDRDILNMDK